MPEAYPAGNLANFHIFHLQHTNVQLNYWTSLTSRLDCRTISKEDNVVRQFLQAFFLCDFGFLVLCICQFKPKMFAIFC